MRTVDLELRASSVGSYAIAARVSSDRELDPGDNEGAGTILVESPADVSVRLRGPTSAMAHQRFTVDFDIANVATDNAGTVTVKIDLPTGAAVGTASLTNGSCTSGATSIECTLTPLGAGATASGSVSLTASDEGSAALHATVSGDYFDTNNANDTADLVIAVSGVAANASPPPASAGASGGGSGGGGSFGLLLLLALAPLHRVRRRGA
jgi:hypothetical protein